MKDETKDIALLIGEVIFALFAAAVFVKEVVQLVTSPVRILQWAGVAALFILNVLVVVLLVAAVAATVIFLFYLLKKITEEIEDGFRSIADKLSGALESLKTILEKVAAIAKAVRLFARLVEFSRPMRLPTGRPMLPGR